jgi:SAM-dependent methyltransferase
VVKKLAHIISPRFRVKRELLFRRLFGDLIEKGCRILDAGGEPGYWEYSIGAAKNFYRRCEITCVNLKTFESHSENIRCMMGDATAMPEFGDKSFDIVFSNSVIEHVGDFESQAAMAATVRRIGRYYFIQTPNYYFPIEPHYLFPFANRLPIGLQCVIARYWPGHVRINDFSAKSKERLRTRNRLLKLGELTELFPDGTVVKERLLGMVKSFIVHNAS